MARITSRNPIPTASRGNGGFSLLTPGYYTGVAESAELSTYQAGMKGFNGQFTYLKLVVALTILETGSTLKEGLTIGIINENQELYRPDGDDEKPALFKVAGWFLSALGFVNDEGLVDLEGFDPRLVHGQVVRIKVATEDYQKDGQTRTKNIVASWFGLREQEIEQKGFAVVGNGFVFVNDDTAQEFIDFAENLPEEEEADEDDNDAGF